MLGGLVCGPIDKNNGELWMACPCLYEKAMEKMYETGSGKDYERIYPKKITAYRKRNFKGEAILKEVTGTSMPRARQRGDMGDVIKAWKQYYKSQGWDKIARFDHKGRLGTPYVLFKAKNITDPEVRKEKWSKARPIAPTFHHPMKKLLHVAGKAWYFIVNQINGEHFVIKSTRDVPKFFEEVMQKFSGSELEAHVVDIEGCYPKMPKEKIRHALSAILQEARMEGRNGVSVPTREKTRKCTWKKVEDGPYQWIDFETLLEVLEFSLDQAILQMKDGRLVRQAKGIPIGDALSPAMTIGTCAWMEREWRESLPTAGSD